jgi:uncharacterized membrane protein
VALRQVWAPPAPARALDVNPAVWLTVGMSAGLFTMYLLDPRSGRRRRARATAAVGHGARQLREGAEALSHDLAHRSRGIAAEVRGRRRREAPSDDTLHERVRAQLGRVCSHPAAVEVIVDDGIVELVGPALRGEARKMVKTARRVPGVIAVIDRLEVHDGAGGHPALLGAPRGGRRVGMRLDVRQGRWAPATRFLAGALGASLLEGGRRGGGLGGAVVGALGAGLLARALTNRSLGHVLGLRRDPRAVDVQKTINVDAQVEEAFAAFRDLEDFPRFMSHVKAVRRIGADRYHWIVSGPAGLSLSWDAEITALVPNELVAWRSVEGSPVANEGRVTFSANRRGGTQIDVHLSYTPPAGVLGHAVAALFGADPKKQLDDDLLRFKSLVEVGRATGRDETVTRASLDAGGELPTGGRL